jgi:hypothetical protein
MPRGHGNPGASADVRSTQGGAHKHEPYRDDRHSFTGATKLLAVAQAHSEESKNIVGVNLIGSGNVVSIHEEAPDLEAPLVSGKAEDWDVVWEDEEIVAQLIELAMELAAKHICRGQCTSVEAHACDAAANPMELRRCPR